MEGGKLDPNFPLIQVRTEDSLTVDTLAAIRTITLDDHFPTKIVGSFRYAIHEYPGDIDLMEEYVGCCSVAETAEKVVVGIQNIMKKLRKRKLTYLGDFKAGVDARYKVDTGVYVVKNKALTLVNYDAGAIKQALAKIRQAKLLKEKEYNDIISLVVQNPSFLQHKKLTEAIRKYYVVRWKFADLERGYKRLRNNVTLQLRDAVAMNTVVKIDIYSLINHRFVEVTNWFLLKSKRQGASTVTLSEKMGDYEENVLRDIEIYKNPALKKHMKLAKRMWLYAIHKEDEQMLKKLFPLFSSSAAKLSQILSDCETMMNMLEKLNNPPIRYMIRELEDIKMRMGTILSDTLPTKQANFVFNTINGLDYDVSSEKLTKSLAMIYDVLNDNVDRVSKKFLRGINHKSLI